MLTILKEAINIYLFFNVNGVAYDTDNNKLHNEKTPQPIKRSKKR
jgi:hypothetical protein